MEKAKARHPSIVSEASATTSQSDATKIETSNHTYEPKVDTKGAKSVNVPKDADVIEISDSEAEEEDKPKDTEKSVASVVTAKRNLDPNSLAGKLTRARKHAQPVKLEDGRDWVQLYKFLSQKPDVGILGKYMNCIYISEFFYGNIW